MPTLNGQNPTLLSEVSVAQAQLTGTEQTWLNNLQNSPVANSVRIVAIGNVLEISQNGSINFSIPGYPGILTAHTVQVEEHAYNDYLWTGEIDGQGYAMILSKPGGKAGFIQLKNKFYRLNTLRSNLNVLVEENLFAAEEEMCLGMTGPASPSLLVPCPTDDACPAVITVLILVTPEAVNSIINQTNWPDLYFALGAQTVNAAFLNSDVANKQTGNIIIPFNFNSLYSSPPSLPNDLNTIRNNAGVASLRSQYQADLVIMLTDARYTNGAGFANVGPGINLAYGIVEAPSMWGPRWTFAHELAHTFGAQHNTTANGGTGGGTNDDPGCVHGFRFFDADQNDRRTIMARMFDDEGLVRILHYSNPAVVFNGAFSGDALDANVAATIRKNGCEVASYFDSQELTAFIDGPSVACNELPATYCADILMPESGIPGQPPYTYAWHWNTTGIFSVFDPFGGVANGGTYLGNSQCVNLGNLACNSYWLQLTVASSDGLTVRSKRRIKTTFCEDCLKRNALQAGAMTSGAKANLIPNPATESVQVAFRQEQAGTVRIALFSISGDLVFENRTYFEAGENSLTLGIGQLPTGIYPVRIEYPSGTETLRLSIIH